MLRLASNVATKRVCLDCYELTDQTRCPEHRRQREQARGSASARGYGADHKALRQQWAPLVATGNVKCARCANYIPADAPWDLDHSDEDRSKYLGPSCAACNRATASRR